MKIKTQLQKVLKITLEGSVLILGIIIITIILKVFCFASFKVPSASMEPTLKSGDYIMVNKMVFGARIFKDWKFWADGNWEMKRLNGLRPLKHNEIIVFNFPFSNHDMSKIEMDFNNHYVKRCIGLPGDTISIVNGFYSVSGFSDTLGVYKKQLNLSQKLDSTFKNGIKCSNYDSIQKWTIKNFGPLYIPKINDNLNIDCNNIELYRKLIMYETRKIIEVKKGLILMDGKVLNKYIFRNNYYFMSGDNVFNSMDSRYWGLMPEDHIIGKVSFIWKSEDKKTGKYRWDRFFKGL